MPCNPTVGGPCKQKSPPTLPPLFDEDIIDPYEETDGSWVSPRLVVQAQMDTSPNDHIRYNVCELYQKCVYCTRVYLSLYLLPILPF